MSKKLPNYIYFQDPGHGWLRVPLKTIQDLKLKVSSYSYQKGRYVYLEEDCDMSEFFKVVGKYNFTTKDSFTNSESRIRNFKSFSQNWS